MTTIWQELDNLKKRVADLEREDMVILEESFQVMNSENLEQEISKINNFIRTTVRKYGKINVDITTEN